MRCREVVELITQYLEDALPPAERARLEAHLEGCAVCREYIAQMRLASRLLGRIQPELVSPALEAELVRAFRAWKSA